MCLKGFTTDVDLQGKTKRQLSFSSTHFNLQNKFCGDFSTWITVLILHTIPVIVLHNLNVHIDNPSPLVLVPWLMPSLFTLRPHHYHLSLQLIASRALATILGHREILSPLDCL